jgi:hypothetical protein
MLQPDLKDSSFWLWLSSQWQFRLRLSFCRKNSKYFLHVLPVFSQTTCHSFAAQLSFLCCWSAVPKLSNVETVLCNCCPVLSNLCSVLSNCRSCAAELLLLRCLIVVLVLCNCCSSAVQFMFCAVQQLFLCCLIIVTVLSICRSCTAQLLFLRCPIVVSVLCNCGSNSCSYICCPLVVPGVLYNYYSCDVMSNCCSCTAELLSWATHLLLMYKYFSKHYWSWQP